MFAAPTRQPALVLASSKAVCPRSQPSKPTKAEHATGSFLDAVLTHFRRWDKEGTGLMTAVHLHALVLKLGSSTEDFLLALGKVRYEPFLKALFADEEVTAAEAVVSSEVPQDEVNADQGSQTHLPNCLDTLTVEELKHAVKKAEAAVHELQGPVEQGKQRLNKLKKDAGEKGPPKELQKVWKFWFLRRETFLELPEDDGGVPRHQELRDRGLLEEHEVHLKDALSGKLVHHMAVFSHRWFQKDHPDPRNIKLKKAKELLKQHSSWHLLWLDWLCLPQSAGGPERTDDEEKYFGETLYNINTLYLGLHVVILYDSQYSGRFWPCAECWSSFQVPTEEGVRDYETQGAPCRATFCCVAGAEGTEAQAKALMRRGWGRTPACDAAARLRRDEVSVANQRDKDIQVEVLDGLDEQVAKLFNELIIEPLRMAAQTGDICCVLPGVDGASEYYKIAQKCLAAQVKSSALDWKALWASRHRLELLKPKPDSPVTPADPELSMEGQGLLEVRHPDKVFCVHALPDGRLMTGGRDGCARVFSVAGQELLELRHGGCVWSVHVFPDGRPVTGCNDQNARIFSASGQELLKLAHGNPVLSVHAMPDGRLVTGSGHCAHVFSAKGDELLRLEHSDLVQSVDALPDGRLLTGSSGCCARVFSAEGLELLKLEHRGWVHSVHAMADGRFITGCADGYARVFSPGGQELLKLQHCDEVCSVHAFPDGCYVTGSADACVRVFSEEGKELVKLKHGDKVWSVQALPDGFLLTGSDDSHMRLFYIGQ
mmetsp:Transcript_129509/g.360801  ORF Transcript_129509/g.360801 Transcript_129509/m.360801 type:complete len:770 (-) Transcript_129509:109-2418(-)